jgi:hypothetical protein
MTKYPSSTDLFLRTGEYRIHDAFVAPQNDVILFKPTKILHRVLTIRPGVNYDPCATISDFPLSFIPLGQDIDLKASPLDVADQAARDFVQKLLTSRTNVDEQLKPYLCPSAAGEKSALSILGSPYDIEVESQCYLVLELDRKINWRFTPQAHGVTTKDYYGADNFGLTFIEADGAFSTPNSDVVVKSDNCQILYFRIARRRPDEPAVQGNDSRQGFNFHIEFMWQDGRTMPMIFDPNVPNGGGASLP